MAEAVFLLEGRPSCEAIQCFLSRAEYSDKHLGIRNSNKMRKKERRAKGGGKLLICM